MVEMPLVQGENGYLLTAEVDGEFASFIASLIDPLTVLRSKSLVAVLHPQGTLEERGDGLMKRNLRLHQLGVGNLTWNAPVVSDASP